jgi:L-ascorbate metabolism protein UlaG (beta-lactamase superfamily)
VVGEVTGFVLSGEGLPTVYVSGDNASLDLVGEIAARYAPVDVALLFAGGARTPLLDYAYLTLTSAAAAEAADILQAGAVVPLHFEQWVHFSEGGEQLQEAFAAAGLSDRLRLLKPGETAGF